LTSRGYVKTQFSWQYYYYTLTDEGVEFLRNELNIPEGILPLTRLKNAPAERPRPARGGAQEEVLSEVEVEIRFNFFNVCKLKIEDQIV